MCFRLKSPNYGLRIAYRGRCINFGVSESWITICKIISNRIPVMRVIKNFAELIEDEESGKMKFRFDALTVQTQVHHVKPAGV